MVRVSQEKYEVYTITIYGKQVELRMIRNYLGKVSKYMLVCVRPGHIKGYSKQWKAAKVLVGE